MPGEIISLDELKAYLQQTTTDFDPILKVLRSAADATVRRYCDRDFTIETYTHYFDGNGKDSLLLRQYPLISITSIHIDPEREFGDDTEVDEDSIILTEDNQELGYVQLLDDVFAEGKKNVKVVYRAGFATAPADVTAGLAPMPGDLKLAALSIAAREFLLQDKQLQGQTSQNVGDRSVSLGLEDLPRNVWMVLEGYKRRTR